MAETGRTNWSHGLPGIARAMNTSTHSGLPHGKTPNEVMFGRAPRWGSYVPYSQAQNAIIENIPNENDPDHVHDPIEDQLDDEELFEDYINMGVFLEDDVELDPNIDPCLQRRLGNLTPLEMEVQAHNTIVQSNMVLRNAGHETETFKTDNIVTLKIPSSTHSADNYRRIECRVVRFVHQNRYQLQCQHGILSSHYPANRNQSCGQDHRRSNVYTHW
jgi:hypothetical protein